MISLAFSFYFSHIYFISYFWLLLDSSSIFYSIFFLYYFLVIYGCILSLVIILEISVCKPEFNSLCCQYCDHFLRNKRNISFTTFFLSFYPLHSCWHIFLPLCRYQFHRTVLLLLLESVNICLYLPIQLPFLVLFIAPRFYWASISYNTFWNVYLLTVNSHILRFFFLIPGEYFCGV